MRYPQPQIACFDRVNELTAAGHTASGHIGDLTRAGDVDRLLSELGSVNVLVNNAGMGTKAKPALEKHLTEIAADEWDHEIAVSLKTAFLVTKAFLPAMLLEGYGRIVNVASVTGPYVSKSWFVCVLGCQGWHGRVDPCAGA